MANYRPVRHPPALLLAGTDAVPVLQPLPGLAEDVPHRLGHLVQRPVLLLQATTAHRVGVSDTPAGGGQQHRRRHRQDDLAAVHRRGLHRREPGWQGSDLFRFTVKHSLCFTYTMVGIITTLQAYVFTWMIP